MDEAAWILSGGITPEWRAVWRRRADDALSGLRKIAKEYPRRAPLSARRRRYLQGVAFFLARQGPERDRLATHPAFDYWLHLWDKNFSAACDESSWHLHFGLFQGFAVQLALMLGKTGTFDAVLDPDAHLHLYGSRSYFAFPKNHAFHEARVRIERGTIHLSDVKGLAAKIPLAAVAAGKTGSFGPIRLEAHPSIVPGVDMESCAPLMIQGVSMHGLARPSRAEAKRFSSVLATALSDIAERAPALHAEMIDLVRVLVPLKNPATYGSVSSSYVNLRGAICLSHSEDALLQAETLIHEFCHQKMNQLLLADELLLPGQAGQAFYSPWRPDARRLRGLILGAHAFLNVADYLTKSLEREDYPLRAKIAVMCNVARRLFEVQAATQSVCAYGRMTKFGESFMLGLCRRVNGLFHAVQWFPPALIKEARLAVEAHRREHALPLTGIYKSKGFVPKVRPIAYGRPRVIRRKKP